MKKYAALATLFATVAITGCTTTGTGTTVGTATDIGMNVFKSAVDSQCRSELETQSAWRIARAAMTAEQEASIQNEICGCVSEQAPQQVTVVDITNATIDSTYRKQLVASVVVKSLQSCYSNIVN